MTGKGLIILCVSLIAVFGYYSISMQYKQQELVGRSADYANVTYARNIAQTGMELGIQDLENNATWTSGKFTIWHHSVDVNADFSVDTNGDKDSVLITSAVKVAGKDYTMQGFFAQTGNFPMPPAVLTIIDHNINMVRSGGSIINGNDWSAANSPIPGVSVMNENDSTKVEAAGSGSAAIYGSPTIKVNPNMTYSPYSNFINSLANSPKATYLPQGNYHPKNASLGSAENPGIFVIENYKTTFSSTTPHGYGILIVRGTGSWETSGSYEFNGLVIFENGWNYTSSGGSVIHGCIVVGSEDPNHLINITVSGGVNVQYDSKALKYASQAAKNAGSLTPGKYNMVTIFE